MLSREGAHGAGSGANLTMEIADHVAPQPGARSDTAAIAVLATVCAACLMIDIGEIALGGALTAMFSASPNPPAPASVSTFLAAVYVGAAIGAPMFGWAADRYGRRPVLTAIMALIAASSLVAAACPDLPSLTLARGVMGLAIGAYPPVMIAFLAEATTERTRGPILLGVSSVGGLGGALTLLLVRALGSGAPLGLPGWRWAFLAFAAGAAAGALAFARLPESRRWLAARASLDQARPARPGRGGVAVDATAPASYRLLLGLLFLLSPWFTVAFPVLNGAILVAKGFRLDASLLYAGLAAFGPSLGALLLALGIDRFARRAVLQVSALAVALAAFAFSQASTPVAVVISGLCANLFIAVYLPTLTFYASEMLPTAHRAARSSLFYALNRVSSAIAPFVLLPLLRAQGAGAVLATMIATLLASMLALLFAPRGRAGHVLD